MFPQQTFYRESTVQNHRYPLISPFSVHDCSNARLALCWRFGGGMGFLAFPRLQLTGYASV